jgi:iron complex outermembrane receptor protein
MHLRRLTPIVVITLAIIAGSPAAAQDSRRSLTGRVVDAQSSQPIDGALISVVNSASRATSGADGVFRLVGVPAGRQTLTVLRIGYARQSVTVEAGTSAPIEIRLSPTSVRLDELVVSADKAEKSINEVPYALSAVTGDQLAKVKAETPADLTAVIPNLTNANTGISGFNVPTIRGINSIAGNGFETAVAIYADGVYQVDADAANFELGDVERVEVLRGPQGTLYGRGALGGVINVISREPTNQARGFAKLELGNVSQQRYSLGVSGPLVKNKLYASVSGLNNRRGAFFQNLDFAGNSRDFDGRNSVSGSGKLKFIPSTRWSLGVTVNAQKDNDRGILPLAVSDSAARARPYIVSYDAPGDERRYLYNGTLTARYFGNQVEVSSTTGRNYLRRRLGPGGVDIDFTPFPLLTAFYGASGPSKDGYRARAWSQEFKVASAARGDRKVTWLVGSYLFRQKTDNPIEIAFDSLVSPIGQDFTSANYDTTNVKGIAFYGQATWAIGSRLDLTTGLRWEKQNTDRYARSDLVLGATTIPGTAQIGEQDSKAVTWRLSLGYRPSDLTTLYGTLSRGFRPGGINFAQVPGANNPPYDPEFLDNYEAGLKIRDRANRVQATAAVFLLKWKDQQVAAFNAATFQNIVVNTGRSTVTGAELELSALPARRFRVDWALGLTDAQYDKLNLAFSGTPVTLDGNRQPFTPKFTSALAAEHTFPLGVASRGRELAIRGDWRLIGEQFFDLRNSIRQGTYSLFGAQASVAFDPVTITVWGKNLAHEQYIVYGSGFGGAPVLLGEPRTIGITLSTRLWSPR